MTKKQYFDQKILLFLGEAFFHDDEEARIKSDR
jgi:hypothetical protein